MAATGDVARNMQAVADLMNRADELAKHPKHNPASRRITNQIRATLPQVYTALNNGDTDLAGSLLDELAGLQKELDDVDGAIALTVALSELVADCTTLAGKLGDE
jgi:hypothetical protein